MKATGEKFSYFFDGKEVETFDKFEKLIKEKEVTIEVLNFRIDARTKQ